MLWSANGRWRRGDDCAERQKIASATAAITAIATTQTTNRSLTTTSPDAALSPTRGGCGMRSVTRSAMPSGRQGGDDGGLGCGSSGDDGRGCGTGGDVGGLGCGSE